MNQTLRRFAADIFAVREFQTVEKWATNGVRFSSLQSEQPGPYSTANHPYAAEVIETIQDRAVDRISLCWGSQTGKTTCLMIMAGFVVSQKPAPILWVFPTGKLSVNFSVSRWMPFCKDSTAIRPLIPKLVDGLIDSEKFTISRQEMGRSIVNFISAGSSAEIKSYPVSILILDEIDAIPQSTRRECFDRVKGRIDFKIVQASTPTLVDAGAWAEFQSGDRCRFFVDCPGCGEKMVFRFWKEDGKPNLIWIDEKKEDGSTNLQIVKRSAFYLCEKCGHKITDDQKAGMISGGRWIAGNAISEPGHRSFHLNSFYSPSLTFGRIAVEYLRAVKEPGGLRIFVNGWLAEPFSEKIETYSEMPAADVIGEYPAGEMKGEFRILSADVQRTAVFWIVRGFDRDGKSYLIESGKSAEFEDLKTNFEKYGCTYGIIDSGFRTKEVYEFCFDNRPHFFAAKGWDKMSSSVRFNNVDPFHGTIKQGQKISLLHVNKAVWQMELLKHKSGKSKRWQIHLEPTADYLRQLNSTTLVEVHQKSGKKPRLEWKTAAHHQDHFFDCEVYALAISYALGLSENGAAVFRKPENKPRKFERSFWK
jgi:phage terminase large subunit GpA-like protein